jgi:ankyrin repeat protein
VEAVTAVVKEGADANAQDPNLHGARPLILAALTGNVELMRELIAVRADPNAVDDNGCSPLLLCGQTGIKPSIEFLVTETDADVNARDKLGRTCLHSAAFFGDTAVVRLLLSANADPAIADEQGNTPMLVAARNLNGIPPPPLPEGAPAPPGHPEFDEEKWTHFLEEQQAGQPQECLAAPPLPEGAPAPPGHPEFDEKEWAGFMEEEAKNHGGPTDMPPPPGHPEFDKDTFGAWLAKNPEFGMQPEWAAVIELLLVSGADGAVIDGQGISALMIACDLGHAGVVSVLLEHGADPFYANSAGVNALIMSSFSGHIACAELLLASGLSVDALSNDGCSPLMVAAAGGHLELLGVLINAGADVNLHRDNGTTALGLAAKDGHKALVEALVQAGADCSLRTGAGETALEIAQLEGHIEVASFLLSC